MKVIIDAYCCAGGATRGYKMSMPGVLVLGIDIDPQPNYCGDGFHQGGGKGTVAEMQAAQRIDWTDVHHELTEAIPPAYADYIGRHVAAMLGLSDDVGTVTA